MPHKATMIRCLRQYGLATFAGVVASETCLAYGGWKTNTFGGALMEVLPHFLIGIGLLLVPYVACSLLMERLRRFYVPMLAYLVYVTLIVWPNLIVMGEPGPAHVAFRFTILASFVFPCLLLAKFGIMGTIRLRQERHSQRVHTDAANVSGGRDDG